MRAVYYDSHYYTLEAILSFYAVLIMINPPYSFAFASFVNPSLPFFSLVPFLSLLAFFDT